MVLRPSSSISQAGVYPDISTAGERGRVSNSNFRWPDPSNILKSDICAWSSLALTAIAWGGSSRARRFRKKNKKHAIAMRVRGNTIPIPMPSAMVRNLECVDGGIAEGEAGVVAALGLLDVAEAPTGEDDIVTVGESGI